MLIGPKWQLLKSNNSFHLCSALQPKLLLIPLHHWFLPTIWWGKCNSVHFLALEIGSKMVCTRTRIREVGSYKDPVPNRVQVLSSHFGHLWRPWRALWARLGEGGWLGGFRACFPWCGTEGRVSHFFFHFPQKESEAYWVQSHTISKNSARSFDSKSRELSTKKSWSFWSAS